MLHARGFADNKYLPLLLTGSPLCNTSHELLADYWGAQDRPQSAKSNLGRVREWCRNVLQIPCVGGIHLFTVDGYDIDFEELRVSIDQLADAMMTEIEEEGDIPSLYMQLLRA